MKKIWYPLFVAVLLFSSTSVALADPFSNPGDSTTPHAFSVTCDPYTAPMISSVSYQPTGTQCLYTLPQIGTYKVVGIYKGTVGNSTPVKRGFAIGSLSSVLRDTGYDFSSAQLGEGYFAASYSSDTFSEVLATDGYLQNSGNGLPTPDLTTTPWKWGPTPPISISVPEPGVSYPPTEPVIPLANIDEAINFGTVVYTLNGTVIDPTQPLPIASLPPGPATLAISAFNNLGAAIFATSTFIIGDIVAPTVVINSPLTGGGYLQNDVASIDATVTDLSPVTSTTYTLNGVSVDPTQMLPFMSQSLGTQTLVVAATDSFGNVGYATSTFTLLPPDLTAPTITISNPVSGATYTDTANLFITANISDASPIAAKSFTFNGATIDPTLPLPLVGAPLGLATVSVAATDKYGNAASSSVSFTIKSSDVTPPTITITNPIAGSIYSSTSTLFAVATINDASGVANSSYTLKGVAIDPTQPLPLTAAGAGPAVLVVTATDNFGNSSSSSVAFTITTPPPPDTQAPTVVITNPIANKKYTRKDVVYPAATITDQSAISNVRYLFNGKIIDKTKALPFKNAPLGNATVSVIATDSFGNVGSSTVTFRIVPGDDSCIADITEAFDHKWITSKKDFKNAFDDCTKIHDRQHDRDDYDNDDHRSSKDPHDDDRYNKAQKDIDDCFDRLSNYIHN